MAKYREERLFASTKIEGLLAGGLESMDAGDRQMLLVMAETKLQDGYEPTSAEQQVVDKLRELAGQEYDARDIERKVQTMVRGPKKKDPPRFSLPPAFDRLLGRLRQSKRDRADDAD